MNQVNRPTAAEWHEHLSRILKQDGLQRCALFPRDYRHIKFAGMPCPQCARVARANVLTKQPRIDATLNPSNPVRPSPPAASVPLGGLEIFLYLALAIFIIYSIISLVQDDSGLPKKSTIVSTESISNPLSNGSQNSLSAYNFSKTAPAEPLAKPKQQPAATKQPIPLPGKLVQDIQTALNQRGFNAGPADGVIGPRTKAAISSVQKVLRLTVDGLPSQALLAEIASMPVSGRISIGEVIARVSSIRKGSKYFQLELYSYDLPGVRVGDFVFIKSAVVTAKIYKIKGKFAWAETINGNSNLITEWQVVRKIN